MLVNTKACFTNHNNKKITKITCTTDIKSTETETDNDKVVLLAIPMHHYTTLYCYPVRIWTYGID